MTEVPKSERYLWQLVLAWHVPIQTRTPSAAVRQSTKRARRLPSFTGPFSIRTRNTKSRPNQLRMWWLARLGSGSEEAHCSHEDKVSCALW